MKQSNRRDFLRLAGVSLVTPYVLTHADAAGAVTSTHAHTMNRFAINADNPPENVFGLSVASGDPAPTGVILWTRVNPEVWSADRQLAFEVAQDEQFQQVVTQGVVQGADFGPERDHTVKIDLDGQLAPNQSYFYRFIYNETASRTGRCRTLPAEGEAVERVRFGVLTCQDYTNGYYGALAQLAQEEIDFVIHLGDFIYESSADPRFQRLPFPDRAVVLPSGQSVAFDLNDYRAIYRTYRSDRFFQMALEQHTWIVIWDDHETANDSYWDTDRDTLGAPDHPYTKDAQFGNDPARLRQLKLDSQRAWVEYVPARVQQNESAPRPWEFLQIYRRFAFGNLLDLFMTDERTYRSPHPCGEGTFGERYASGGCAAQDDPNRTLLGTEQRSWLLNGLKGSQALWKVWGNEVYQGALRVGNNDNADLYLNLDAWDGYEFERDLIMKELKSAGVRNLVLLTGDLHSYIASYLKIDYTRPRNSTQSNLVGVEFMTPAVTSANFSEIIANALNNFNEPEEQAIRRIGLRSEELVQDRQFVQEQLSAQRDPEEATTNPLDSRSALEFLVRLTNPHVKFFNSEDWGYSTIEFNRTHCEWTAYSVDKSKNSADASRKTLKRYRVPVNRVRLEEVRG
jgi:alkaline phosphatase D